MLRAIGMGDDDWDKPQVGVASSWNEVTPCNMPLDRLAKRAKEGVRAAGGFPIEFVTIAVSDGISMGHEGMRASLVSREVIADSVETVMHAERFDALVTFAGCDKSLPGMLMAAARLDLPSVFLYGGSILPGHIPNDPEDRALDVVSVFEAVGARAAGTLTDAELALIERHACPTEGSCAGMFTANTMASVAEAIGMALPGSSSPPAVDPRRDDFAFRSGEAVVNLLDLDLRPRKIMTKAAFENAIAIVMALGGSTNAVLHLLAMANEARVDLELEDFNRIGRRVPHIADTKPHGKYHMTDIDRIGGVAVVMRELLDAGPAPRRLPHRHRQDDGREPRRPRPARARRRRRSTRCQRPIHADGGIAVLTGSLAPEGRWSRSPASTTSASRAPARVFDGEDGGHGGDPGRVDRARHCRRHPLRGPQGRPGHARDARRHRRDEGRGPRWRLRPPHRRSLLRRDARVLHRPRRPRSRRRRPHRVRAPTATGSSSTSRPAPSISWSTTIEIARRRVDWKVPTPRYTTGVLAKFARLVQGAERGAITEA